MNISQDRPSSIEVIKALQADKIGLKEALRAAISKRDELYNKIMLFDQALKTQKERTHSKEKECELLQNRIEEMEREQKELLQNFQTGAQISDSKGRHKYRPSWDTSQLIESAMSPRQQNMQDLMTLAQQLAARAESKNHRKKLDQIHQCLDKQKMTDCVAIALSLICETLPDAKSTANTSATADADTSIHLMDTISHTNNKIVNLNRQLKRATSEKERCQTVQPGSARSRNRSAKRKEQPTAMLTARS